MVFYCPNCWKELPGEQQLCPHCGQKISSWDEKAFTDKLLQALSHPEPETQMRAVYLLGERRTQEAVGVLTQLFRRTPNPFLKGEVVEAIGKIGGDSVFSLLMEALHHPSFIVVYCEGRSGKSAGKISRKRHRQMRAGTSPQRPKFLCAGNRKRSNQPFTQHE